MYEGYIDGNCKSVILVSIASPSIITVHPLSV